MVPSRFQNLENPTFHYSFKPMSISTQLRGTHGVDTRQLTMLQHTISCCCCFPIKRGIFLIMCVVIHNFFTSLGLMVLAIFFMFNYSGIIIFCLILAAASIVFYVVSLSAFFCWISTDNVWTQWGQLSYTGRHFKYNGLKSLLWDYHR